MNKSDGSNREILIIVIKYLIRRFFRIYIPFFIFAIYFKLYSDWSKNVLFFELITIQRAGYNVLWTIIVEVKYYFIIPIFTFIAYKAQKYLITWIVFLSALFCLQLFNLFGKKCIFFNDPERENLLNLYPVFLNGSLLGIIYYKIQNYSFNKLLKLRFLIGYISFFMFLYGIKWSSTYFTTLPFFQEGCQFKFSIYWSIFIFVILLDKRSMFKDFLNFSFLKKSGKYSFGIYLLHVEIYGIIDFLKVNNLIGKTFIETLIAEIFLVYYFSKLFFYLIENPGMNIGNLLIKKIPAVRTGPVIKS